MPSIVLCIRDLMLLQAGNPKLTNRILTTTMVNDRATINKLPLEIVTFDPGGYFDLDSLNPPFIDPALGKLLKTAAIVGRIQTCVVKPQWISIPLP